MRDLSGLDDVEMSGILFQSIAQACMNLRFVLGASERGGGPRHRAHHDAHPARAAARRVLEIEFH